MNRTRVKICGITNPTDAVGAADAGVDAVGLVFAESKRQIDVSTAESIVAIVPPFVSVFGVFMDQEIDEIRQVADRVRIDTVQLHGRESKVFCAKVREALEGRVTIVKRIDVGEYDVIGSLGPRIGKNSRGLVLLDPAAGGGKPFRWELAAGLKCRFILSGGLTPGNVAEGIRVTRPYAVDVSSGVEKKPGKKDHLKMRAFVTAVQRADFEMSDANRIPAIAADGGD